MQASNGPKKEAELSALQEHADMIEQQRKRLHDGIERIYAVAHAWCSCDYTSAFNNWREHITNHIPKPPTNPYRDK